MARRPRIVITAGSNPGTANHAWLRFDYLHAISKAHGLPSIIAPGFTNPLDEAEALADEILDNCDGLLLSGGTDVDPEIFGEQPHTCLGRVDGPRDPFEITLAREAIRRTAPHDRTCPARRGSQTEDGAHGWRRQSAQSDLRPSPTNAPARPVPRRSRQPSAALAVPRSSSTALRFGPCDHPCRHEFLQLDLADHTRRRDRLLPATLHPTDRTSLAETTAAARSTHRAGVRPRRLESRPQLCHSVAP